MSWKYYNEHEFPDLLPDWDDLPKQTWRNEGQVHVLVLQAKHRYPTQGCYGGPLEADHPNRRNGP